MISSGVLGGGIGPRAWWLNAQVPHGYADLDPQAHLRRIASALGLDRRSSDPTECRGTAPPSGPGELPSVGVSSAPCLLSEAGLPSDASVLSGVGLLTAADVTRFTRGLDHGVQVWATVGLGLPVWAAAAEVEALPAPVGTINVLAVLPVPMTEAALVNAVVTMTEAKTQALLECGIPGTGTASDAVCVACPVPVHEGDDVELFGGPRSTWGHRLARATHAAVRDGTRDWLARTAR